MAFAIVTDSSSNLTEEVIDQFDLHILPLTFMVDGEEHHSYLKGQKTDLKQFYTMMREGKVITTSLPNLKDSRELLEGLLASGQDVLYIGFSSGLSGTYQAIDLLLAELADAYPDRTVLAVDTLACSSGTPPRCARRVRPSPRFATGWRPTSCIWPTGSPWTTSCSYSAAAASPARAPGPAPF